MNEVDQIKEFKKHLKVENVKDAQKVLNTLSALVITKRISPRTANTLIKIIELQLKALEIAATERLTPHSRADDSPEPTTHF